MFYKANKGEAKKKVAERATHLLEKL
jgi:hypothetical protein